MRRRKPLLLVTVAVAALGAAAAFWLLRHRTRPAPAAHHAGVGASSAFPSELRLSGTIRARQIVAVPASVEGILEQFMVEPGQEIFEGQLLARIHNGGLEAARQAAQADLERAEARVRALESGLIAARLEASRSRAEADRVRSDFERIERNYQRHQFLYKEGAVAKLVFEKVQKEYEAARQDKESVEEMARLADERLAALTKELDSARASLEEKREALEQARQNLAAAEVHSPVDGVLLARNRQVGDPVGPHVQDLLQIAVELSSLEVVVEPEPPALERIRPGQDALVEVVEGPPSGMPGRIVSVEQGRVVVEFSNPSPAVKPGMTAQVRISLPAPAASQ